jgi:hypothetical protein
MKKFNGLGLSALFFSLLMLASCNPGSSNNSLNDGLFQSLLLVDRYTVIATPVENTYTETKTYQYFMLPPFAEQLSGQNVDFQYTFDTNGRTKDIYFIFTNISPYGASSYPIVTDPNLNISQNVLPDTGGGLKSNLISANNIGLRGKPEISEFNRNPYAYLEKINPVKILLNNIDSTSSVSGPQYDIQDTTQAFKIDSSTSVPATCRLVRGPIDTAFGPKTLNIWVANDCWIDGGTKTNKVTPAMVTALADKFLYTDSHNDDIYDWVSNIYSEEWGGDGWSSIPSNIKVNLIDPNDEITILLYDIDNNNSTSGGVLGYFWSKDNFKISYSQYSNQRIMLYLDAVLLATNEGSWDITDRWPAEIVSTLAHEFQHMIHFYQKTVLRTNGAGTETWIDEMCSLVTEDLVSDKLGLTGPRGVDPTVYTNGSAGLPNNTKGRLPIYNYFNDVSLTYWYKENYVLVSYGINYAFGAYLARNYGGAQLFRNVVQNGYTDYRAIESVLTNIDPYYTFGNILQRWAISNLLSDYITTDSGYQYSQYNITTDYWFTDTLSYNYNVGSINLENYVYKTVQGPYIYSTMPTGTMPPASNEYYLAANNLYGSQTWNIKLKSTVRLSVLAK